MDGLDVYVDDYNTFEPIGEELLRNLNQARGLIFDDERPGLEFTEETPVAGEPSRTEAVPSDDAPAIEDIAVDKNP
ncbi:MAG: hypothetical protein D4S02_01220 [Rhodocyclaceae bacterium]|nr:MAG: hypothetical protein D4S02_01220 [Rhodocyclaceae bacterium]